MVYETDALQLIARSYRELTGSHRELQPSDRLEEDLDIDSLLGYVILCALEEVYGSTLAERIQAAHVRTIEDLVDVLKQAHPGSDATMPGVGR
jgi:acyl carrier protein